MKTVAGIGEILWDVFPGRKVLGGAPANFVYHASQFGCEGYAVSAVGHDLPGKEVLDTLSGKGFRPFIASVDDPTGTVQVTLDEAGIPQYEICEHVAWDAIPFTPEMEALARRCDAVCFGTLAQRSEMSRHTIRRFLDVVPDESYKIFDINLRQHFYSKEIIHASLLRCNVLKINDDEVVEMAGLYHLSHLSEQEICSWLLKEYGLKMVIETKGAVGSCVLTATERSYMDTPVVRVADTVGAGDAFTGAFVAALLHGEPIRSAHRLAVEVAAYVCTQDGAMPELPDTLVKLLKK